MKIDRFNTILILIVIIGFCFIGFGIVQSLYAKTGVITPHESASCIQMVDSVTASTRDNPEIRPLDPYGICKEGYVRLHLVQSFTWVIVGGLIVIATILIKKFFFK